MSDGLQGLRGNGISAMSSPARLRRRVMRVEDATRFLLVDFHATRELGIADAGLLDGEIQGGLQCHRRWHTHHTFATLGVRGRGDRLPVVNAGSNGYLQSIRRLREGVIDRFALRDCLRQVTTRHHPHSRHA